MSRELGQFQRMAEMSLREIRAGGEVSASAARLLQFEPISDQSCCAVMGRTHARYHR